MLSAWSPKALWLLFMSLLSTRSCLPMSDSAALYSLSLSWASFSASPSSSVSSAASPASSPAPAMLFSTAFIWFAVLFIWVVAVFSAIRSSSACLLFSPYTSTALSSRSRIIRTFSLCAS